MKSTRIKDVMTAHPFTISPEKTVKEAAELMKEIDCGVLPVGELDKVVGMITDRDITLRVTAEAKDPVKTLVKEVMSHRVYGCEESDTLEDAADEMRKHDVSRLLVTKGKKATGIVSIVGLLRNKGDIRQSTRVLNVLLKSRPRPMAMADAGAGCEL